MSSVRYGTRLGDLKNKQSTHTHPSPLSGVLALSQSRRWQGGEEEDLFVFNDTIEGPRAPAVKPGRVTQAQRQEEEEASLKDDDEEASLKPKGKVSIHRT